MAALMHVQSTFCNGCAGHAKLLDDSFERMNIALVHIYIW